MQGDTQLAECVDHPHMKKGMPDNPTALWIYSICMNTMNLPSLGGLQHRQIKCFPDKVKLKGFIIAEPLYMKCERDLPKKKKIKTMNSKMTTNSKLSTIEPKTKTKTRKANN